MSRVPTRSAGPRLQTADLLCSHRLERGRESLGGLFDDP